MFSRKRNLLNPLITGVQGKGENSLPLLLQQSHTALIMNTDELLKRYAAGERDFTKANLAQAKLIGANLVGIKLWGADLSGANLAQAKLWGANLCGANLVRANLTRANLCGANLVEANLRQAKLKSTKLYGANLSGACYDASTRFSRDFDPASRNMRRV